MVFAWFTFLTGVVIGAVAGYFAASSRLERKFVKGVTALREEVEVLKGELSGLRLTLLKSEEERERLARFNVFIPDVIRKLTSLAGTDDIPFVAVRSIKNFFHSEKVYLFERQEDGTYLLSIGAGYPNELNGNVRLNQGEGMIGMALEQGKTMSVEEFKDLERHSRVSLSEFEKKGLKAEMVVPVTGAEETYGAIALSDMTNRFPEEKRYLSMIGDVIALSLDKAKHLIRPEVGEHRDDRFDIYNKAYFMMRLVIELKKAESYMLPLSLVLFTVSEIDGYRAEYGEEVVSSILSDMLRSVRDRTRRSDFLARYEGDTFALVMISSTREQARMHAARLCEEIRSRGISVEGIREEITVTLVSGVSGYPEDGYQGTDLIREAEESLVRSVKGSIMGVMAEGPGTG